MPASDRRRQPEHGSSLDSWVVEYIGPSEDSHLFIETAREEGLDATYSPLMSARRGEEIFEVGEVTVTGRELRTRTARAMNRVLQRFPVGYFGFAADDPGAPPTGPSKLESNLHGFMKVSRHSVRVTFVAMHADDDVLDPYAP